MKPVEEVRDVYPAVEELIVELNRGAYQQFANVLDHRMHKVAWSTGSELLDELQNLLTDFSAKENPTLPTEIRNQVQAIVKVLNNNL